jgi:pSer/pThr/pTyr-binding forkhead associated (FHA) protein
MDVKLVMIKNNGGHKSFPLAGEVIVLGRRHDCDLRIPLMSVSRKHCQINLDNGNIKVRDLDSSNGTLINGEIVNESVVKAGDEIKIGPLSFVLQVDGVPEGFTAPSKPAEPKEELSDILDEAIVNEGVSEADEGESDDIDFLLSED